VALFGVILTHEFSPIDDLKQIVGHTSQWETGRAKQHNSEGYINITGCK
jgi:hypothetical protein